MTTPTMSFFSPGTELGVLENDVLGLRASAHAPSLWRADQTLADIRGAILRTHEAHLQVKIATSAGYEEHRQVRQTKVDDLDQRVANATAALRAVVNELRVQQFQRFAASMVIGAAALRHLFLPRVGGKPPRVLRAYIEESVFID